MHAERSGQSEIVVLQHRGLVLIETQLSARGVPSTRTVARGISDSYPDLIWEGDAPMPLPKAELAGFVAERWGYRSNQNVH